MPRATSIKVAVVGCGAVARLYYAPALRELETVGMVEVAAVVDPERANAAALLRMFPNAVSSPGIAELLQHQFDLAIVCSPNALHASHTIELLRAGKSVLCEKPMATSVVDAAQMEKAARSGPGLLAVGLLRRFFPASQTIRRMLTLQMIGTVTSFEFSEGAAVFDWPVASAAYFTKQQAHGGVLLDIGVHVLDLMNWWFGEPLEIEYEDDAMGGIELNSMLRCKFAAGVSGEVRLSRDCSLSNRCVIRGTSGWISWAVNDANHIDVGIDGVEHAARAALHRTAGSHLGADRALGALSCSFEQSFTSQLCNVVGAMQGTQTLLVPASEGIKSLRLIETCYRRRSLMRMPWLSEREVRRAREFNAVARAAVEGG